MTCLFLLSDFILPFVWTLDMQGPQKAYSKYYVSYAIFPILLGKRIPSWMACMNFTVPLMECLTLYIIKQYSGIVFR